MSKFTKVNVKRAQSENGEELSFTSENKRRAMADDPRGKNSFVIVKNHGAKQLLGSVCFKWFWCSNHLSHLTNVVYDCRDTMNKSGIQ